MLATSKKTKDRPASFFTPKVDIEGEVKGKPGPPPQPSKFDAREILAPLARLELSTVNCYVATQVTGR